MNAQKVREVVALYKQRMEREDVMAVRHDDVGTAETRAEHACWMLFQIEGFLDGGQLGKAFRWLGFVQAVLWTLRLYTINEMRDHNRSSCGEDMQQTLVLDLMQRRYKAREGSPLGAQVPEADTFALADHFIMIHWPWWTGTHHPEGCHRLNDLAGRQVEARWALIEFMGTGHKPVMNQGMRYVVDKFEEYLRWFDVRDTPTRQSSAG